MAPTIDRRRYLKPETKQLVLKFSRVARGYGFTEEKAKGWAMYALERKMQGGDLIHPSTFVQSKYNSADLYDRLVGNTVEYLTDATKVGMSNFLRISGLPENLINSKILDLGPFDMWENISRGRDLFIRGWGTFNCVPVFPETLNMYGSPNYRRVARPDEIRSIGYLGTNPGSLYWGSMLLEHCSNNEQFKDYCGRHLNWIRENLHRIDELCHICAALTEANALQEANRLPPNYGVLNIDWNAHPAYLLDRYIERMPDTKDDEYQNIEFPIEPVEITKDNTTLKIVSSSEELADIGYVLHNCAERYTNRCCTLTDILVVALDNTKDIKDMRGFTKKPIALGQLVTNTKQWAQILGPCNEEVSKELKSLFLQNTGMFLKAINEDYLKQLKEIL